LVLAVGLLWLVVIGPLVGGAFKRAAERRDLRAAYQTNQRLIASAPALRASLEIQRKNATRFAVTAPSEALAVEALKERLQRLSSAEGFTVTSIEDLQPDAPVGGIKLRADLTLTLTQLVETLRRLESEDAYVVVEYLSISADRSLVTNRLAPIDARLELSAAWRRPSDSRP
jgi:hypothetical protein